MESTDVGQIVKSHVAAIFSICSALHQTSGSFSILMCPLQTDTGTNCTAVAAFSLFPDEIRQGRVHLMQAHKTFWKREGLT